MVLSKEEILNRKALKREVVSVPEWGGDVLIRELTAAERDEYETRHLKRDPDGQFRFDLKRARLNLVLLCMVNEHGERLFSEDDVESLGGLSSRAIERIFAKAQRLSGIADEAVEDAEKN